MHSLKRLMLVVPLLFVAGLAACGGPSGLAGDDRKLNTLEPADLKQICAQEQQGLSDDEEKAIARYECLFEAALAGRCDDAEIEQCVKDTVASLPHDGTGCDISIDKTHCDITVAELDACRQESIDALVDATKNLTCADDGHSPDLGDQEACKHVYSKCPSALDDE
jgi:hypothetical protein